MSNRLPRQVQAASDRAQQLIDDFTKSQAGQGKPADAPAGAVTAQDEHVVDAGTKPGEAPASEGTAAPVATGQPRPAADRIDYKAKYFTLQGMYNADLKAAKARIEDLEAKLVSGVHTGKDAPVSPTPASAPAPAKRTVPDAVREALGDDISDALQTMFDQRDKDLRGEINESKSKTEDIAKRQVEDNKQRFIAELTRRVPDWTEIDSRDDWNEFLAQRDPLARRVRNELMIEAVRDGDVDAVEAIFNAFKTHAGIPTGVATETPPPTPAQPAAPPAPARQQQLERQAVPHTSSAAASRSEKKVWTRPEIAKAYADAAMGRTPPDVFAPIEADILSAGREGRIA